MYIDMTHNDIHRGRENNDKPLGGHPESCEVQDGSGKTIGTGTEMKDTDFIGIAIGIDSTCVVEFESDGGGCPIDEGNGPLHGQGKGV